MKSTRSRSAATANANAVKWGEMSLAVPQVVAHRLGRMAWNGPVYSARDQAEFVGMVQEKQVAWFQSWMAMCLEAGKAQQTWWQQSTRALLWPTRWPWAQEAAADQLTAAWLRVGGAGLAPVHAKAVSNARRLARTPLVERRKSAPRKRPAALPKSVRPARIAENFDVFP